MRRQLHLFFTALMFYTRLPVPKNIDHNEGDLNKATRYFPLIGWIVGGIAALVFYLCHLVFPVYLSILFSTIAGIWVTGAFHEDGFADVCDGFGGGWSKEQILEIMKDSRLGTYGTIGLLFMLLIKMAVLIALPENIIPMALFAGHSISRWTATGMIYISTYSRTDALSKVKPIGKKLSLPEMLLASFFGLMPLVLLPQPYASMVLIPAILLTLYLKHYFTKWIDGYTGDCLGATQQLNEVLVYISLYIIHICL